MNKIHLSKLSVFKDRTFAFAWVSVCISLITVCSASASLDLTFERDSGVPMVYVSFAIKPGSIADPKGRLGLGNFMGELMLRGTRSKSKAEIDRQLDQLGGRLEVEARTDALIFRGAVLSRSLPDYLSLVTEILTQPAFSSQELAKLKSQISSGLLEELGRDSALGSRKFNQALFGEHPYGNSPLGTRKNIEAITSQDVNNHHRRMLRQDQVVFVASGDTSEETIRRWAESVLAKLPPGASVELPRPKAPVNSPIRNLVIVDKPDRTQTQIFLGQIGVHMKSPDFFPLYLGNHAFGGGNFTARLMTEVRVKRGWSYGAYSSFRHGAMPRSWQLHLFPASKDTAAALNLVLTMVDDVKNKGITTPEFEFSRASLINGAGFMYNTPKKRIENTLLEKTLDLPTGFMRTYADQLAKVSLSDVNGALSRYLKPDQMTIVVLATAKDLKDALVKAAGVADEQVQVTSYLSD